MSLFRIMLATITLCLSLPTFVQGQQHVTLDTAAISTLKGHWTGTASGTTGSIPVEITVTDVQPNGHVVGTMYFPQTPRGPVTQTFGAAVDRSKLIGTATFDGTTLTIATPFGTSYTLALKGSKLEGPYNGNLQSGSGTATLSK